MANTFSQVIPFKSTEITDSEKLFIKLDYRKITFFYDFPKSDFFPYNSLTLRVLDLTVFEGDNILSSYVNNTAIQTITYATVSSGSQIFLHDSTLHKPLKRIIYESAILDLDEKLKFENLSYEFFVKNGITRTSIPNCLHDANFGYCIVCDYKHELDESSNTCNLCLLGTTYVSSLGKCIREVATPLFKNIESEMNFKNHYINTDIYTNGTKVNVDSTTWTHITNTNTGNIYFESNMNKSRTIDLSDSLVHVYQVLLGFQYMDLSKLDNVYYGINFNNDSNISGTFMNVRFPIDQIDYFNGPSFAKLFSMSPIILSNFLDTSYKYSSVFMNINDLSFPNFYSGPSSLDFTFLYSDLFGSFENSSVYPNTKIQPVTFPLEFESAKNYIYIPFGILKYHSLEYDSTVPDPPSGYYFEINNEFKYIRKCPEFCEACRSFYNCSRCESNYFLRDGSCFPCDTSCIGCETTSSNCLISNQPVFFN